ncbi:hypothetical protein G9X67_34725 [Rhizobium sp. WYCCWR 11152]|uniref:hypothetical protein n=1 Tax=Rhizobium sp. WYCCWR 11152 TaxID=2692316 RepID=UPI0014927AA2|nr:hypothetical protein [Rhizobium sp. WYCCWR 11152]NNU70408.1 hypothetical protein [Rhizobium sp. WYCCWR 11152]
MTDVPFDAILHMDDPNFAEKLADAIGLKPGDTLEIHTPQFERVDGVKPIANPEELFEKLHTLPKETLKQIGMCPWDENGLWLFPHQWYGHIPHGMPLTCIDGSVEPFEAGVTDDDMRFGVLAYGIVPDFAKASPTQD